MKKRIEYIDIAKAIGIILVILGHVTQILPLTKYIYSFHMPLFFFLSGITTNFNKEGFVMKKFKTLMIPYYTWYFIFYLYWCFFERKFRSSDLNSWTPLEAGILGFCKADFMIPNIVLWFLPALFLIEISSYFLNKFFNFRNKISLIGILLITILGSLFMNKYFNNYSFIYCFEAAIVSMPFYIIGFISKDFLLNHLNVKMMVLTLILSLILFIFLPKYPVDIRSGELGNYFLFYVNAFIGIIVVFSISYLLRNINYCSYLGKVTMALMIFHDPLKRLVIVGISKISSFSVDYIRNDVSQNLIVVILLIVLIIPVDKLLNKFVPWSLGKFT